jgi:Cu(I)/Ag(I) efflux system membrane fusion protein
LQGLAVGEKVVASGQFLLDSEASLTGIAVRALERDATTNNAGAK